MGFTEFEASELLQLFQAASFLTFNVYGVACGMMTRSRVSWPTENGDPEMPLKAPVVWSSVNPETCFGAVLMYTSLSAGSTAIEDGWALAPNWIGVPAAARSPAVLSVNSDRVSPPVSPTNTKVPLGSMATGPDWLPPANGDPDTAVSAPVLASSDNTDTLFVP